MTTILLTVALAFAQDTTSDDGPTRSERREDRPLRYERPHMCVTGGQVGVQPYMIPGEWIGVIPNGHLQMGLCPGMSQPASTYPPGTYGTPGIYPGSSTFAFQQATTVDAVGRYRAEGTALAATAVRATTAEAELEALKAKSAETEAALAAEKKRADSAEAQAKASAAKAAKTKADALLAIEAAKAKAATPPAAK